MTTRRLLIYAAIGLTAYLVTVLALLPASWLSRALEKASNHILSLRDPTGTVWHGSARLVGRGSHGAWLDLGPLRWTANSAALLRGRLAFDLHLTGNAVTHMEIGLGGVTLERLDLELPGALLASVAPGAATVSPEGRIRIRANQLSIDSGALYGAVEIEWHDLRVTRPTPLYLGSHIARVRGIGESVDIELASLAGPLRVVGMGSWTRQKGLDVSGTASAMQPAPPALTSFLQGMCAEYRDARCTFRVRY